MREQLHGGWAHNVKHEGGEVVLLLYRSPKNEQAASSKLVLCPLGPLGSFDWIFVALDRGLGKHNASGGGG